MNTTIYRDTKTIKGVFTQNTNCTAAGEYFTATKQDGYYKLIVDTYSSDKQKPVYKLFCGVLRTMLASGTIRLLWQDGTDPKNRRNYTNVLRIYNTIIKKGYTPEQAQKIALQIFDQFESNPQGPGVDAIAQYIITA